MTTDFQHKINSGRADGSATASEFIMRQGIEAAHVEFLNSAPRMQCLGAYTYGYWAGWLNALVESREWPAYKDELERQAAFAQAEHAAGGAV